MRTSRPISERSCVCHELSTLFSVFPIKCLHKNHVTYFRANSYYFVAPARQLCLLCRTDQPKIQNGTPSCGWWRWTEDAGDWSWVHWVSRWYGEWTTSMQLRACWQRKVRCIPSAFSQNRVLLWCSYYSLTRTHYNMYDDFVLIYHEIPVFDVYYAVYIRPTLRCSLFDLPAIGNVRSWRNYWFSNFRLCVAEWARDIFRTDWLHDIQGQEAVGSQCQWHTEEACQPRCWVG